MRARRGSRRRSGQRAGTTVPRRRRATGSSKTSTTRLPFALATSVSRPRVASVVRCLAGTRRERGEGQAEGAFNLQDREDRRGYELTSLGRFLGPLYRGEFQG